MTEVSRRRGRLESVFDDHLRLRCLTIQAEALMPGGETRENCYAPVPVRTVHRSYPSAVVPAHFKNNAQFCSSMSSNGEVNQISGWILKGLPLIRGPAAVGELRDVRGRSILFS